MFICRYREGKFRQRVSKNIQNVEPKTVAYFIGGEIPAYRCGSDKIKLSLRWTKYCALKMYWESGGIATRILDLDTW